MLTNSYKILPLNADLTELKKHGSGTSVNLTTSDYTIPTDGYIRVYCNSGGSSWVHITLNDDTNTRIIANGNVTDNIAFVKKGMTAKITSSAGTYTAIFIPLV